MMHPLIVGLKAELLVEPLLNLAVAAEALGGIEPGLERFQGGLAQDALAGIRPSFLIFEQGLEALVLVARDPLSDRVAVHGEVISSGSTGVGLSRFEQDEHVKALLSGGAFFFLESGLEQAKGLVDRG